MTGEEALQKLILDTDQQLLLREEKIELYKTISKELVSDEDLSDICRNHLLSFICRIRDRGLISEELFNQLYGEEKNR